MAVPEGPPKLSHVEGISDYARARELYKYYQPSAQTHGLNSEEDEVERDLNVSSNVSSSKMSSPDTALTVFCQLTAWRMGFQRAMISVIDAETQYFVAESTRTLDLTNNNLHAPGDGLWLGCSNVSKAGRLCESTIAVAATKNEKYPYFIVNDLSKDERFNKLPFVSGAPFLKRYIGVPLITKRGIPIGSLFVVDDRPGNGLSEENLNFLGTMAKTVMRHFELLREVQENRRGIKMSLGISSLIEGRDELFETNAEKSDVEDAKTIKKSASDNVYRNNKFKMSIMSQKSNISKNNTELACGSEKKESASQETKNNLDQKSPSKATQNKEVLNKEQLRNSRARTIQESCIGNETSRISDKIINSPGIDSEDLSIRALFSRAAYLIQMTFELDGGSVFYDARTGSSETISDRKKNSNPFESRINSQHESEFCTSDYESEPSRELKSKIASSPISPNILPSSRSSHFKSQDSFYPLSNVTMNKRVEILGYSTCEYSSLHGDEFPGYQVFKPLRHKTLQKLLRQYPRGKILVFNEDGTDSSSEQSSHSTGKNTEHRNKVSNTRTRFRTDFISKYFPGVHQLLFIPLWDAGRSRWFGGCFTWSKDPTRILSKQMELNFLAAFGNCVMAEWARIDTEIADKKKSDFIGSISHELRSPLHGILASVEFLEDVLSGWEKHVVETIKSCGRTLLDTINHVLDYSKISHFESHWCRSKQAKHRSRVPANMEEADFPMVNLYQDIDISVVCEEVIDSVYAGYVLQNNTAQSFNQISDTQGNLSNAEKSLSYIEHIRKLQNLHSDVVVALDFDPKNYHVTSQPGALRRLIMNLLGNSLKYTSHGYIVIKLECHDIEDFVTTGPNGEEETIPRSMLVFTITDTGRGIAPEFLRNKLYIPFAQENILSSGIGLGLSIVRAIVSLLEGEVSIDSEIGRGTHVQVSIPVLRRMPQIPVQPQEIFDPISKQPQSNHNVIFDLCTRVIGYKVSLYGFSDSSNDSILTEQSRIMRESITNYLVNWYHMQIVPYGDKVDLIIANAVNNSTLSSIALNAVKSHGNHPCIIVLHCYPVLDRLQTVPNTKCKFGYTTMPIGPTKLAKAIIQTMDGLVPILTPKIESKEIVTSHLDNVIKNSSTDGHLADDKVVKLISSAEIVESPMAEIKPNYDFNNPSTLKNNSSLVSKNESSTITKIISISKPAIPTAQPKVPSILVVDDNHINLRLLTTYLSRRAYPCIDTAQNGLEAVHKFEAHSCGYDIIFMDITMPVLDGFGASRQIRGIEEKMRSSAITESIDVSFEQKLKPALIIAFTGRSSTEDQNEAIRSGINLFMIKPVPFREVGKICDNWIAKQKQLGTASS